MKTRRWAAAVAVLLAASVVAAGCGGQKPAATPGATPAGGQQAAPVKIGAALSLTGSYERYGKEVKQAYELWVEQVNSRGGLLGRKVELKVYDDQSEPETGAKLYEKLITDDKADLLFGPYSTAVNLSATAVTEKYKFPMLPGSASGTKIWERGFKYVFGMYSLAPTYGHGGLEIAKGMGFKTVALVNEDTAFPQDMVKGAEAKARELGLEVVFKEQYPTKTTDFSVLIQKIKAKNPDVVMGGTYLPDSTGLVRQAKDAGLTPKMFFFTTGPALPDFGKNLGPLAEGVLGNTEWEPSVTAPGAVEFTQAYQKKYGYEPGYHAAGGYAVCQVMEAVVKQTGGFDKEKIREALASLKMETIYGPYQVDPATGKQIAKPNFVIQWQDGKRVVVWPDKYATGKVKLPFAWK